MPETLKPSPLPIMRPDPVETRRGAGAAERILLATHRTASAAGDKETTAAAYQALAWLSRAVQTLDRLSRSMEPR